jgi:hypothetical protein
MLGVAYLALGIIAGFEVVESHRTYGVSRFGLGYILMATSCGPHHLLHASHVFHGQDISTAVAIATLIPLKRTINWVMAPKPEGWDEYFAQVQTATANICDPQADQQSAN